jgi:hypothetical protein
MRMLKLVPPFVVLAGFGAPGDPLERQLSDGLRRRRGEHGDGLLEAPLWLHLLRELGHAALAGLPGRPNKFSEASIVRPSWRAADAGFPGLAFCGAGADDALR